MAKGWWKAVVLTALCAWLAPGTTARAQGVQDRVVIAGGADVTGMNALDVLVIVPDRSLMDHLSDTLLRWKAPGELGPWLATSWKNIDDLTWELRLRQGVRFHNGEPFNAAAVKFFYDTMNDPAVISPSKTNHSSVARVEIVDDYTVRLITRRPYPVAPTQWALAHMIPPGYVKQVGLDGYRRRPIGTGPFKFIERVPDTRIVLQANDDWWGGPQRIKTLIYRPIKEDAARAAALVAGEVDVAIDLPHELLPLLERARNVKVQKVLTIRTYVMLMSTLFADYPTVKREVREAIAYAIDRESLATNIMGGLAEPAAWMSPTTYGYNPALKPIPYDPERAKRLLAEAGYPNGIDITLDAPYGKYPKDKEVAEAMTGQLAKAGIRTTVKNYEWGVLTKRIFSHQASPLALIAWGDTNFDPDSHNRLTLKSGSTWSQAKDPQLDDLIDRIAAEMNPEKRKTLLFQEQDYLRQAHPVAYLVRMGVIAGVSSKLDWWKLRADEKYYFFENKVVN
jgi:peptide/nickel transport system substrate-binding protein